MRQKRHVQRCKASGACTCICPCICLTHSEPWAPHTCPPLHRNGRESRECLAWGRMDRPCSSRYGRGFRRSTPRPCPARFLRVAARYEAVREARHFTRGTLDQWDLGDRFDDVMPGRLRTRHHALRHALPADAAGRPAVRPVRLHLMRWTSRLVCAVRDPSHDTPIAGDADDFSAESGRGLFLVDSFADSWGWHPLAGTLSGKVVWALFSLHTVNER